MQSEADTDTLQTLQPLSVSPADPSPPLIEEDTSPMPPALAAKNNPSRMTSALAATPPLPDLVKFRDALIRGMLAKRMTASNVARQVWGSKTNSRGVSVARNRDRMTHYLAGKAYPRPETVLKLAEVLELDPAELEREPVPGMAPGTRLPPGAAVPAPAATTTPRPLSPRGELDFSVQTDGTVIVSFRQRLDMQTALEFFDGLRKMNLVMFRRDGEDKKP